MEKIICDDCGCVIHNDKGYITDNESVLCEDCLEDYFESLYYNTVDSWDFLKGDNEIECYLCDELLKDKYYAVLMEDNNFYCYNCLNEVKDEWNKEFKKRYEL